MRRQQFLEIISDFHVKKRNLQEESKARSWREIELCLIMGWYLDWKVPVVHLLHVLGPMKTPGQRGHGAKRCWCFERKINVQARADGCRAAKQAETTLLEGKAEWQSTVKLQGQQKSLSKGNVIQFVTRGTTKILQLPQNGSFFLSHLSLSYV